MPEPSPVLATTESTRTAEISAAMERIKGTIKRITEQRDGLPSSEQKARLDDIASRLATANDKMEVGGLRALLRDCDAALAVFNEATEFREVSSISARKVDAVSAALAKLTFDAPLIQEIKASIEAVKTAQTNGSLPSLKIALAKLNQTYDSEKLSRLAEAKSHGFDSTESYEDFKTSQAKLSKSGIRLNAR